MKISDFGSEFVWGTATAAYQIEGGFNSDGKGLSIWDVFSHKPGEIANNDNGDVACDFYHRFLQDLDIMQSLHIPTYRFSLSWSRIFPQGTGQPNPKGVDFYHQVIDACLERGIQPWITLYHWDLPQALEERGGWVNRDVVDWFCQYTDFCVREWGNKVKHWMILNEPMAFTSLGYMLGYHAPGKKGVDTFIPAMHHACLVQGEASRTIRSHLSNAEIGSTFSCSEVMPFNGESKHLKAVKRYDVLLNRLFVEPALGMGYPAEDYPMLNKVEKVFQADDAGKMKADLDFIGIQNYSREVVKRYFFPPYLWAKIVPPHERGVPDVQRTAMNWEIYPKGIYQLLKRFAKYPNVKKMIVTENGAAFVDKVEGDFVHDSERTRFIQEYLAQVLRARNDGVPVEGYFVWSFLDNFEWREGYAPRFGLVHVDYETQQRRIKDSGFWYRDFLTGE